MKKKTGLLTVSLPQEFIQKIKEDANKDERSVSNFVYVLLLKGYDHISD